jgi:hypothetical protein
MPDAEQSSGSPAGAFERIGEYQAVLEDLGRLSARRQNLNDVFVAINSLFLTGLGVLLVMTRLDSWWLAEAVGLMALAITPINVIWRTAILRYKSEVTTHVYYLSSIEREFRQRREATAGRLSEVRDPEVKSHKGRLPEGEIQIGFYLYNDTRRRLHGGKSRLESRLADYFVGLFPGIALLVAVLTYLITNGIIPPMNLK